VTAVADGTAVVAGAGPPTGPLVSAAPAPTAPGRLPPYGLLGDPQTRLLAGPPPVQGAESLGAHLARLGPLPLPARGADVVALVGASGLAGRGGGEFPVARKLAAAAAAASADGAPALVVANCSEGEPASRKDRTLVEHRPQLVLDGADVAARAVGAPEVVVYLHATRPVTRGALAAAVAARAGRSPVTYRMVEAPDAYVAGESSAVVRVVEGGGALPSRRRLPVAVSGVHGRPTVVSNAESLAHLALLARFGAPWFTLAGSPEAPGSSLLTLAGAVARPGAVVEVLAPVPLGDVLRGAGGLDAAPPAVLVGGYAGRWIPGEAAFELPVDRAAWRRAELGLGCGLVAPLPATACGLATTLALLGYLASQSAGQCGPCVLGLPSLARDLARVVEGSATRGDLRRLAHTAVDLRGRGDCGHPDGAITLLESALEVFAEDAARHVRGRPCGGRHEGWFPLGGPAPLRSVS